MKIILLQNIKSLGKNGDIKEVAEGYAQNFLLPRKMAKIATKSAINVFRSQKEKKEKEEKIQTQKMMELVEKLKKKKIIILAKHKNGKLFGSVVAKDIAEALKKEGLNISVNSIIIKKSIKKIGSFEIGIKLSEEIKIKIPIEIKGE